jgi:hypothetical protein
MQLIMNNKLANWSRKADLSFLGSHGSWTHRPSFRQSSFTLIICNTQPRATTAPENIKIGTSHSCKTSCRPENAVGKAIDTPSKLKRLTTLKRNGRPQQKICINCEKITVDDKNELNFFMVGEINTSRNGFPENYRVVIP